MPHQAPPPFPPQPPQPTPAATDPSPAAPWRRALAWGVDFALMVLLAVGLGFLTYQRMTGPVSGVSAEAADGARKLFSSGFDVAGVAAETGAAVWGEISGLIIQGFVALVVIQFLYQLVALAWTGRTLGKALFDLRVAPAAAVEPTKPGVGRSARRAAVTALTDTGLFSIACCLLVTGWFALSVACWALAVAAFWANALPSLARRRRSLADLTADTVVAEAGRYRAIARNVSHGGQVAAARLTTEAQRLAENERVRQAWESQRAQQLRQAGKDAADRGRQAWESQRAQQLRQGAADKGRQAWSRLKNATGETTPAEPTAPGQYPPPAPPQPLPPPTGYPQQPPAYPAPQPPPYPQPPPVAPPPPRQPPDEPR